jgi:hypothetical protein
MDILIVHVHQLSLGGLVFVSLLSLDLDMMSFPLLGDYQKFNVMIFVKQISHL